ncbi:MAG: hypothetical protein Q9227_007798 [Pyrenula ochraceoflavens]
MDQLATPKTPETPERPDERPRLKLENLSPGAATIPEHPENISNASNISSSKTLLESDPRDETGIARQEFYLKWSGDKDHESKKWVFLWQDCFKWEDFNVKIQQTFEDYGPEIFYDIAKHQYELQRSDSVIIRPQEWSHFVKPGDTVSIFFPSAPGGSSSAKDDIALGAGENQDKDASETERWDLTPKFTVRLLTAKDGEVDKATADKPYIFEKYNDQAQKSLRQPVLNEYCRIVREEALKHRKLQVTGGDSDEGRKVLLRPEDQIHPDYVQVQSPFLLNSLRAVIQYTSIGLKDTNSSLEKGHFGPPYKDLYFHLSDLRDYQKREDVRRRHGEDYNDQLAKHLDALEKYLYSRETLQLAQHEARWKMEQLGKPKTTFSGLWLLYKPGTDVYVYTEGSYNAYVIESAASEDGKDPMTSASPYVINAWNLCFDGRLLSRKIATFKINPFDGERNVESLQVIPTELYKRDTSEGRQLKADLIRRGKKYVELIKGPAFRECSGYGLFSRKTYERARIVVSYSREFENEFQKESKAEEKDDEEAFENKIAKAMRSLNDCDCELCEKSRAMRKADTSPGGRARVAACDCDKCKAFREERRLYPQETFKSYDDYDVKSSEGSMTADLGREPETLEKNLLLFFRNAKAWDAVVLLDEADIYLETRGPSDFERNSVVSIFLRALDYFQGILFLTTNRIGKFDEAFSSRIHVQIGYDPLDNDARAQIWNNSFEKLRSENDKKRTDERKIEYDYEAKLYVQKDPEVLELKWNGREIRNAFQTAVSLAYYEAKNKDISEVARVEERHLKSVVQMSTAFRKYLNETLQHNPQELAFKRGIRKE